MFAQVTPFTPQIETRLFQINTHALIMAVFVRVIIVMIIIVLVIMLFLTMGMAARDAIERIGLLDCDTDEAVLADPGDTGRCGTEIET